MKRIIKYGGAVTGYGEMNAISRSVAKSHRTRNWQQGEEGALFEQELSNYLGTKYAILTNSGSSAGLLALSALELPRGSEVIISAVTFPTIFNIILQCGLTPVVVDAKIGTYGFDIAEVEKAITARTRAIIAIHPCGNPVDMKRLMKLSNKYAEKIYIIEDNCDGFGGTINGKLLGSFGDISFTSCHAAHIISMGTGGCVFTNNKKLAGNVRMYRDWGRQADLGSKEKFGLPDDYNPRFIYEKIGYNFQILDLQAAMGRVQLRKIDKIKSARKKNFDYLIWSLSRHKDLILPHTVKGADVCWFALPLSTIGDRGKLVKHLEDNGIETRSMFSGDITKHPAYRNSNFRISGKLSDANFILHQSFWISVHPSLKRVDLEYMVKVFDDYFK